MEGYAVSQTRHSTLIKQLPTFIPKEPNDLTMSVGDVIDIVEETNPDWWTGRNGGKQGLFPSNYVQKLHPEASSQPQQEKLYVSPGHINHGSNPPPQQQLNTINSTPAVNSVGLQPGEGQDKKKKFGKFGNTVRLFPLPFNSPSLKFSFEDSWLTQPQEEWVCRLFIVLLFRALTHSGFGAGAAVGSGIINALF